MNKQSMCSNRLRRRYCIHQDGAFPQLGRRIRGDPSAAAMIEKQSDGGGRQRDRSLKRAIMIDSWMEKQSSSSSESSSGRGTTLFSSSETESCYRDKFSSSGFKASRPKPLRSDSHKSSDGLSKTKLGESKKPKQPISPGRRISIFLNSIFSSGNGRKAKMCSVGAVEDVNIDCRSKTQPFSRSCMTKTERKINNGAHKTVRFYPVGIIVDGYSRPCGSEGDPSLMPAKQTVRKLSSKNVGNVEVEMEKQSISGGSKMKGASESDEEDQDCDASSCASSDLFELDHLIGKAERFREELPVYETTSLETNKLGSC